MGLFDFIFPKKEKAKVLSPSSYFQLLNAYTPVFSSWSGELYESELVRAAIDARSRHISKLSIKTYGAAQPKLQTRLQHAPSSFQTWSQFMYRLNTILDMQNTAFIVPIYDDLYQEKIGICTFLPSSYELIDVEGEPWLRFHFANGSKPGVSRLSETGILTKFQYKNDLFGEDNAALTSTMNLINLQQQGIQEAVKASASYSFMATLSNFSLGTDLKTEQQKFTANNLSGEGGGILLFPNTYKDIKQIVTRPYTVDTDEMKMIQTNVYNYFGVNDKILQNTANGDELDAFFNGAIEPFSIQFSDVLTKMLFTPLEQARESKIVAAANRLQYMTISEKVSMAQQLGDRGAIMIDEIRDLFNLPPLPNDAGQQAPIRGEYYMVGDPKPEAKPADPTPEPKEPDDPEDIDDSDDEPDPAKEDPNAS